MSNAPPRRYASRKVPEYVARFLNDEPWNDHNADIQANIKIMSQSDMGTAWDEIDRIHTTHPDFGAGFVLHAAWLWRNINWLKQQIKKEAIGARKETAEAIAQIKKSCDALHGALEAHADKLALWNNLPFGLELEETSFEAVRLLELELDGKADPNLNLLRLVEGRRPVHLPQAIPRILSLLKHLAEMADPAKPPALYKILQQKPGAASAPVTLLSRGLTCYVLREIGTPADRLVAATVSSLSRYDVLKRQVKDQREQLYREQPEVRALDRTLAARD